MELRELSAEVLTGVYHQYMTADFPADELKPLEHILYTMEMGLCCAYGTYEQEELRGYAIFIVPGGQRYGLLDYFAVLKEYRGTGVGHTFFELVGEVLATRYPAMEGFFIESENIEFAADEDERRTRERRISFYRQNDCVMTTLGSRLFGVDYSILVYDLNKKESVIFHDLLHSELSQSGTNSEKGTGIPTGEKIDNKRTELPAGEKSVIKSTASATLQDLDNVYRVMFKKYHYENDVSVWDNAYGKYLC